MPKKGSRGGGHSLTHKPKDTRTHVDMTLTHTHVSQVDMRLTHTHVDMTHTHTHPMHAHTHTHAFDTGKKIGSQTQCVAACCSVLQCVAVCCSVLQQLATKHNPHSLQLAFSTHSTFNCVLQRVAMCCSVSQQLAFEHNRHSIVCCSVLQCVAVCCSNWQVNTIHIQLCVMFQCGWYLADCNSLPGAMTVDNCNQCK